MKAVGFDLGHTLINYKDTPLSWKSLYRDALLKIADCCNIQVNDNMLSQAENILCKYNTRISPRVEEVSSTIIFNELLSSWNLNPETCMEPAKQAFFGFFQRNSCPFDDTVSILQYLKAKNIKVGILTDVAYGMDKKFVLRDIEPISEYINVLLTSVDVGFRKPDTRGFSALSSSLGVQPSEMIYVGDEEKDIIGANAAGIYSVFIGRHENNVNPRERLRISSLLELKSII